MRRKHGYPCPRCGKKYYEKDKLYRHMEYRHKVDPRNKKEGK